MGKRIKWFNEQEVSDINAKMLDYVQLFEPGKAKDKSDTFLSHEDVQKNYRDLEKQRAAKLQGDFVGFLCPTDTDKQLKILAKRIDQMN